MQILIPAKTMLALIDVNASKNIVSKYVNQKQRYLEKIDNSRKNRQIQVILGNIDTVVSRLTRSSNCNNKLET